jgi:hypothetical protein
VCCLYSSNITEFHEEIPAIITSHIFEASALKLGNIYIALPLNPAALFIFVTNFSAVGNSPAVYMLSIVCLRTSLLKLSKLVMVFLHLWCLHGD